MRSFMARHIPGIWPDLAFGFFNKRSGSLRWSGISRIHFKQEKKLLAKLISERSNFQKRPQCERGLFRSTTVERKMKNLSVPRPSLRWLRDQERLERFWRVGSSFSTDDVNFISQSIMIEKKNQSFVHVCDLLTATVQSTDRHKRKTMQLCLWHV